LNATVSNGTQTLNQSKFFIRTGSSSPPVTFFLFCRPAPNKVCACSTACASCYKNSLIYRPELPGFSFSTKKIHLSINSKLLLKSAMIVMVPPGLWPTGNLELSRTSVLLFSQVKEILAAWKLNSLILIGNYCIISR
jgi:hypothetical protein